MSRFSLGPILREFRESNNSETPQCLSMIFEDSGSFFLSSSGIDLPFKRHLLLVLNSYFSSSSSRPLVGGTFFYASVRSFVHSFIASYTQSTGSASPRHAFASLTV